MRDNQVTLIKLLSRSSSPAATDFLGQIVKSWKFISPEYLSQIDPTQSTNSNGWTKARFQEEINKLKTDVITAAKQALAEREGQ